MNTTPRPPPAPADTVIGTGKVRASRGVPGFVWGLMALALAIVFMQGTFVVMSSGFGRVWPASDAVKVPLK